MSTTSSARRFVQPSYRACISLIPPIETYPRVIEFVETTRGKLALVAISGVGLAAFLPGLWEPLATAVGLGLTTFLPRWRRVILAMATLAVSAIHTRSLHFMAVVILGLLLFGCARRYPQSVFGRRPILVLLVGYALIVLASCTISRRSIVFLPVWTAVGLISRYIWFIGYSLTDRTATLPNDLPLEAGSFQPFWGSTNTPFPKGAAFLRRVEARDAEELAYTQLKGVKLLVWALLLNLFYHLWTFFFHTYLNIPSAFDALAMSVKRTPYPWYVCWESQVLSFFESLLLVSILGHPIIACCRIAGFNAPRNTYRPLSSPTVIDFFNRFYYYFKELLVEFFFFPTFFRCFTRHRRLRLVVATFSAAAFGNMFYHFTRDYSMIANLGIVRACINFQVFAFYCLLLATVLSISQLRRRNAPRRSGFIRGRLGPAVWVMLIYCLLDIFGSTQRNYPLTEHFRFLANLFGIRFA